MRLLFDQISTHDWKNEKEREREGEKTNESKILLGGKEGTRKIARIIGRLLCEKKGKEEKVCK